MSGPVLDERQRSMPTAAGQFHSSENVSLPLSDPSGMVEARVSLPSVFAIPVWSMTLSIGLFGDR